MESKKSKIDRIVEVLRNGGVIVYPTETVYGLGADIKNESAVSKVYVLKGREFTKPLSIAVKLNQIKDFAKVSDKAQELIDRHLPGPLTLILPKRVSVPLWISSTPFVGIRVPAHIVVQEILNKFGPITSTSANLSGSQEASKVEDLSSEIRDKADLILYGGEAKYKKPSTVVKVVGKKVEVLRKGVIDLDGSGNTRKIQKSRRNLKKSKSKG